jgi:two-component system, chemotaxis family, CheB/CheR fusion protein
MNSNGQATPDARATTGSAREAISRRVLVVDDNHDARAILELLLTKLGHEVATAHDGPSGIAASRQFCPQFILCDITMGGGMSGYAFAKAARSESTLAGAWIIAVSGCVAADFEDKARAAGFDRVLTKPVGISALQQILRFPLRTAGGFQ